MHDWDVGTEEAEEIQRELRQHALDECLDVVETGRARMEAVFPYVPGLLSFREAPALIDAWHDLQTEPDLLVCDGHGRAHPRRFGLACHLGVWLDHPTIGCAKNVLVGDCRAPAPEKGAHAPLRDDDEVIGRAVRTRDEINPVFVSIGHRVSLETATRHVLEVSPTYKIPEPIRAAHAEVNDMRSS